MTQQSLETFIRQHKIRMDYELAAENPNMMVDKDWDRSATHYRCILRRGKKQMTVPFSQGSGITHEPTAADVLDCLASDAAGATGSFADWCSDYGYHADSRKAEKTYQTIIKQSNALEQFLDDSEAYETLLYKTERL